MKRAVQGIPRAARFVYETKCVNACNDRSADPRAAAGAA